MRSRLVLPVIAVVVAAVCVRLAFWQLHRLHERQDRNAQALAALALPRLELTDRTPSPGGYRRVEARGRWDYEHEIVLRQQTFHGAPGVVLVTPLLLDGGRRAVMVARGFVPSPDGMTLPATGAPEGADGQVLGTTQVIPSRTDHGRPIEHDGATTWARLDRAAISARVPVPVMDVYVVEEETRPRSEFPRRVELPALDNGPHLSYAIQWFAFATIAVGGAVIWLKKGRRSQVASRRS
ncbi:MAG TPA: SURF1 family protein [Gemmatimonadales bacterium]|jgi:surfeit locus 1 family protein|nr:SURF1 family protein [Gemmatimonadales bacterium]